LQGRAVQDVWIAPTRAEQLAGAPAFAYGTTLRFYDRGLDAWRCIWANPASGSLALFTARESDGGILLESQDGLARWVFSEVDPASSFHWRAEVAEEPAGPWRVVQEMPVRRTR
jgi:hypothetical protein